MEKAAHIIMYTFGGGALVAVAYGLGHIILAHADPTSGACAIAFGVGAVAGFLGGLQRKFA